MQKATALKIDKLQENSKKYPKIQNKARKDTHENKKTMDKWKK